MWISILNYNSGQVEFHDISQYQEENYPVLDDTVDENYIAEHWLTDNNFNLDEVEYMVTNEAPELYDGNTQTIIDIPL